MNIPVLYISKLSIKRCLRVKINDLENIKKSRCLLLGTHKYTLITKNKCYFRFPDSKEIKVRQDEETCLKWCQVCHTLVLIKNE